MNTLHKTVIRRRPTQEQGLLCLAEAFRAHDPNEGGELLMREFLDHWTFPAAYSMDVLSRAQSKGLVELASRTVGLVIVLTRIGAAILLPLENFFLQGAAPAPAALTDHALDELHRVAQLYDHVYGQEGLNVLAEQFCRIVAPRVGGPEAWTNVAVHVQKISG